MSVAWVAVGAAAVGTIYSSKQASKASDKASQAAQQQLAWDKEQYNEAKTYLDREGRAANAMWSRGMNVLNRSPSLATASFGTASMATAYDAQSYDMKAYQAKAFEAELDGFLQSFKEASETNDLSLSDFNRRYGNIMDNLETSILNVEQSRLSASGREQLMLDADTMKANFRQQMAKTGLTRSGITSEMEKRMAMDTQREARAIDVNSYAQSNQLQAQGTQALNSVFGIGQNIAMRDEMLSQNKASGLLAAAMQNSHLQTNVSQQNANLQTQASAQNAQNRTNVSLANAANKTNVSRTNATNATNVSMGNAANATNISAQNAGILNAQNQMLAQSYMNRYQMGKGSQNAFYSGVGAPDSANLINSYNQQAQQYNTDAAGYAKSAGYLYKTLKED